MAALLETYIHQHCLESRLRPYSLFCCVSWDMTDRTASQNVNHTRLPSCTYLPIYFSLSSLTLAPYSLFKHAIQNQSEQSLEQLVKPTGLILRHERQLKERQNCPCQRSTDKEAAVGILLWTTIFLVVTSCELWAGMYCTVSHFLVSRCGWRHYATLHIGIALFRWKLKTWYAVLCRNCKYCL